MMYATPYKDWKSYDFITGNMEQDLSIVRDRYYHLMQLDWMSGHSLRIALKDFHDKDKWSKWKFFSGDLLKITGEGYGKTHHLSTPYDVHRSMLTNEIIAESDYPTYEENYEAITILGPIIEKKGFIPHYYYSGNKSIHVHIFLDWKCFLKIDQFLQDQIFSMFRYKSYFQKSFIKFLRKKIISCWDTNTKKFDEDLIHTKHLIRSELSRNKKGYKTFLGYTWKDISFVPYICNEETGIYPKIASAWNGELKLSSPKNIQGIVEEWIKTLDEKKRKAKIKRKEASLYDFFGEKDKALRPCVEFMLSKKFLAGGDGFKRAMFILANELRKLYGDAVAGQVLHDWNGRMEGAVLRQEIDYRIEKNKIYTLDCEYIHGFLRQLGHAQFGESC